MSSMHPAQLFSEDLINVSFTRFFKCSFSNLVIYFNKASHFNLHCLLAADVILMHTSLITALNAFQKKCFGPVDILF